MWVGCGGLGDECGGEGGIFGDWMLELDVDEGECIGDGCLILKLNQYCLG